MRADIFPPSSTRRSYLILGFLIVLAWVLLAVWQGSIYADLLGHESLENKHIPPIWHLAAFLLSWFLMTVAMMLPGSLPKLIHIVPPARSGRLNNRLAGWIILGYLAPWVLFGLLAYLGDSFLHEMTEPGAPLANYSGWIAPLIILVTGLYQFTPVKRHTMDLCRTPPALTLQRGAEKMSTAEAWNHGLQAGAFCVGSCWLLMLLLFALGLHHLVWMLVLGGILTAERLAPWGYRLAWLVGFMLVVWAAFWILASG